MTLRSLVLLTLTLSGVAQARPLSPWTGALRYGLASDFARNEKPRAYENVLVGDIGYQLKAGWSVAASASLRFLTLDGQIPKDRQQEHSEVLEPGTMVEASYTRSFSRAHSYLLNAHGEPLWARDSRLEGHRGLIGIGGSVTFGFFDRRFTMTHLLDATSLINTYKTNSSGVANPDYFYTYRWTNALRFLQTWRVSYSFGAKVTRYLDDFIGYSYTNSFAVSKTHRNFSASLSYDNGGFTDEGYISLWYIDEYRRVMRFMISYAF